jgi:hypothetical protein
MKMILAGVAFAALLASPVFAQPLGHDGQLASVTYRQHDKQFHGDSTEPTSNRDSLDQELCETAHDFCPGYHGDNG